MKYNVELGLNVEASSEEEAIEKVNALEKLEGFSDVSIEYGPEEVTDDDLPEEEETEE